MQPGDKRASKNSDYPLRLKVALGFLIGWAAQGIAARLLLLYVGASSQILYFTETMNIFGLIFGAIFLLVWKAWMDNRAGSK